MEEILGNESDSQINDDNAYEKSFQKLKIEKKDCSNIKEKLIAWGVDLDQGNQSS